MKAVLDTNVLVSGIFFGGVPRQVLDAWADGQFELFLSPSIFDEYTRTCERLAASHPNLGYQAVLATIVGHGTLVADPNGHDPITADPDDDKFMLCADRAGARVISGDKHLATAELLTSEQKRNPRHCTQHTDPKRSRPCRSSERSERSRKGTCYGKLSHARRFSQPTTPYPWNICHL